MGTMLVPVLPLNTEKGQRGSMERKERVRVGAV